MLTGREPLAAARGTFLAATAEALPLATGAIDLVFLSLVYYHLGAKTAALAELRRVARAGGHVIVRQVTRESADEYEYVRFFPDALALDLRRMPSRDGLTRAFLAEGFGRAGHRIVRHLFARSYAEYHRKISLRGLSSLQAISDGAFARGLAAFERHCRARAPGRSTSRWSCSCSGGRDVGRRAEVARRDAPLDLGISEVDGDAERVEPVHALELVQLEVLHLAGQVAEVLEVLDVAAVLVGLGALGIDDGDLPGLRHALARALDQCLVDPLLDDLVADVVGAIHVESLFVEPEPDRERRVLDEDEVGRLERHRELVTQLVGPQRDTAGDHELPEPEALEVERIEAAVLDERGADVHLVVDAVGLLLLEVVRKHPLSRLLLEVEVRGDRVGDPRHALLEQLSPRVDRAEARVERGAIGFDPLPDRRAEPLEMIEEALDVGPEERDNADLVARIQVLLDLGRVLVHPVEQLVERGQPLRRVGGLDHVPPEPELRQHVGLDREAALDRGAAYVREGVEGVDALEDDRLELAAGLGARGVALDGREHRLAETPLHDGVDGRALLLDERLDPGVQLLHAPLHGHREEGQDLVKLWQVRHVQIAGMGRFEVEGPDDPVLVEERRDDEVAGPALDDLIVDGGPVWHRGEVVDDEPAPLAHRALVD